MAYRKIPLLTRTRLLDLYVTKQMSSPKIAAEVGCSLWTVRRSLQRAGIRALLGRRPANRDSA